MDLLLNKTGVGLARSYKDCPTAKSFQYMGDLHFFLKFFFLLIFHILVEKNIIFKGLASLAPVLPLLYLEYIVLNTLQYNLHQFCSFSGASTSLLLIALRKVFNYFGAFIGQSMSGSMSLYVANIIRGQAGNQNHTPSVADKCQWQ